MIKQRGLIYLEQKKQEKMILQRCLSSYLKQKHKNINGIFWAAQHVGATSWNKGKKGVFGAARCCAAPIFTPFCPHLHAETRRSLISWEIAGFCALGGALQRRRPEISRGTRDWKTAWLNPGCIHNHVIKQEDIWEIREKVENKGNKWNLSGFFPRSISRSFFFQHSDPEHPEILFWATWGPNSWPPPRPLDQRSPGRCYTTGLMWSTAKLGHVTHRQIRITW